jgi:CRP/FNR family transcriptional regulator, cyclic AMP receptor protein
MSMPLQEQIRLLSMVDIFEPLSPDEVESLAQRAPDVHLGGGETFVTPWDEGERLFVLKRGRVQIYRLSPNGEEITLSVVQAGNIFGEMALTGQHLSEVYARAMEPSVVCSLLRSDLEQIILRHPEVGLKLVRRLSQQLREAEIRMSDLIYKGVPARLASLIERLAENEGVVTSEGVRISTRYTQERLATMIGAKRVAVTRAFNLLRQNGAVELKERYIYVKDPQALKRIADEGQ